MWNVSSQKLILNSAQNNCQSFFNLQPNEISTSSWMRWKKNSRKWETSFREQHKNDDDEWDCELFAYHHLRQLSCRCHLWVLDSWRCCWCRCSSPAMGRYLKMLQKQTKFIQESRRHFKSLHRLQLSFFSVYDPRCDSVANLSTIASNSA